MKAELIPENGDPPIPIVRDVTILGRHPDCDVVIEHPSLSKRHCVLVKTDGLLVIRDLATTNGTKVKGQRVRWAALLPEDRVSFGAYKVKVYLGSDEMRSPSERRQARHGKGSGPAKPELFNGGFEIVADDDDGDESGAGSLEGGGFELVEDDEEIIDLG